MADLLSIDWHAVAVLAIAGMTFWLFASERLPVQTSALLAVGSFPQNIGFIHSFWRLIHRLGGF